MGTTNCQGCCNVDGNVTATVAGTIAGNVAAKVGNNDPVSEVTQNHEAPERAGNIAPISKKQMRCHPGRASFSDRVINDRLLNPR